MGCCSTAAAVEQQQGVPACDSVPRLSLLVLPGMQFLVPLCGACRGRRWMVRMHCRWLLFPLWLPPRCPLCRTAMCSQCPVLLACRRPTLPARASRRSLPLPHGTSALSGQCASRTYHEDGPRSPPIRVPFPGLRCAFARRASPRRNSVLMCLSLCSQQPWFWPEPVPVRGNASHVGTLDATSQAGQTVALLVSQAGPRFPVGPRGYGLPVAICTEAAVQTSPTRAHNRVGACDEMVLSVAGKRLRVVCATTSAPAGEHGTAACAAMSGAAPDRNLLIFAPCEECTVTRVASFQ